MEILCELSVTTKQKMETTNFLKANGMKTYKLPLLLMFLLVSNLTLAQKKKNDEPLLKVQHQEHERFTKTVKPRHFLKIKLVNQDELIKGYYTQFNDSTMSISDTVIAFKDIELMTATDRGGVKTGVAFMTIGAFLTGAGFAFFVSNIDTDALNNLVVTGISYVIIGSGIQLMAVGGTVVFFCTHIYKSDKWKLFVSYPE
jgi:hypothetical protein